MIWSSGLKLDTTMNTRGKAKIAAKMMRIIHPHTLSLFLLYAAFFIWPDFTWSDIFKLLLKSLNLGLPGTAIYHVSYGAVQR